MQWLNAESVVTGILTTELDRTIISRYPFNSENKMYNPQQLKKKTNHDIAYLVILLLFVVGIFIFAMNFVNTHLPLP